MASRFYGLALQRVHRTPFTDLGTKKLATPNYQYEKRQKDLAKKKKQEEKRLRKTSKHEEAPAESPAEAPAADQNPPAKPD